MEAESGGHRIQRVPPTERRGRVHTSTCTVSVLRAGTQQYTVNKSDIRYEFFSGTGGGGQHRNKHQNCVRAIHEPTGITVTAQTSRSRHHNVQEATKILGQRLEMAHDLRLGASRYRSSKELMGSGERGDKIRTYRFQDGLVKDHRTGRQTSTDKVMNGEFWLLW